jgi:hypothetical protein
MRHGSRGVQYQEWLCWRGPGSIHQRDKSARTSHDTESWGREIWSQIPWDPKPRMTVLVRASNNLPEWPTTSVRSCKTKKFGHETCKTWKQEWVCWRGPTAIYLTDWSSHSWVRSLHLQFAVSREQGSRGIVRIVRSHYQAKTSEDITDWKDVVCAVVISGASILMSVTIFCSYQS